ncbi:MAG: alpha/beta fold hydrolase [Dokdonella sp.]|mgnify:CR=1 FL=1|uniref:alpha/beta hydrolase family protein n=1 Tax=Dokdonella sp. TaxID=2291710 RepID=UPI002CFEE9BD|nr:alpha/beta fold hydrolase [Dokdonella sp.]HOX70112.1 alpha/beta fold hydrolase [Dokdonella sp.]HPN79254.1 alpha/beta fold hydrolase [Dokdonella sp.]
MTGFTTITCADGVPIKARWMRSAGLAAATVVVAPGAAAEARFYVPFCEYLAATGLDVLLFDFRGIGESVVRSGCGNAGFLDWIEQDYPAVISHARAHGRSPSLVVVGHSAGGWMAAAQACARNVDALIGVAALSGHWRHMARPHRYAHWLAWHALVPVACRTIGFWPGRIGFRKNLPPAFGLQFSRWARERRFVFSESEFARNALQFEGRLHLFQIADDPWGTKSAVEALERQLINARSSVIETVPRDRETNHSIGHFGAFRKSNAARVWPLIANAVHGTRRVSSVPIRASGPLVADNGPTTPDRHAARY